jgi:hypothetical protein
VHLHLVHLHLVHLLRVTPRPQGAPCRMILRRRVMKSRISRVNWNGKGV